MEFRSVYTLRGPNIWARFPVLEAWVDLGELKDTSSEMIPGFNDRLKAWLPSLVEHRCSVGERGGFFVRLERGTYLAHILEHVPLELQTLIGMPVGFGRARESNEEGVYKVAIQFREEEVGRACLHAARDLCLAAVHDQPFDVPGTLQNLRNLAHNVCLGPSTSAIVRSATLRGIPHRRLNSGSLVQLGYGSKQRRILAAETENTPAIAESIAQDKELTKELLRTIGVPVPYGRTVSDADDAWAAAEEIGVPVVVKPQYGNQGRGVATNLSTRAQVAAAYQSAVEQGESIIVEKYAPGDDWRLLVVAGKLVAAARREPAHVIGDGASTITRLIEVVNQDPRRSDGHATSLSWIPLDSVSLSVLQSQGYTADSVPPRGEKVLIRRNANLSTGGTAADVTDRVHPEVAARAIEAARMVGLDVAGVDMVAVDISRPLEEQDGVIVEVNAGPGLRMHLEPSSGQGRPVGEALIDSLFAPGDSGRIPIVGVTGTNGKTTTTRLIAHLLRTHGWRVGMTTTDGIYVDERRIATGDCAGPGSAGMILQNPLVDAAVLETARGGILRSGLAFDRCDVAVMTNIGDGDHLGTWDIDTPERMAWVKRTLTDSVAKTGYGVFKADDPLVAEMALHCPGQAIFFALDENHPVMQAHKAEGKRLIFPRDGQVIAAMGNIELSLAWLEEVPLTQQGRVLFQVENVLAAAAAAWALNLPAETIRQGLRTFGADMGFCPGRFNLLEVGGATVILDYGHNPSALQALLQAVEQFPHDYRTAVYSAAGDRRDSDMIRQGEMLGNAFDRVILYEDKYLRGRPEGQIMGLFRQGLAEGSRVKEIEEIRGGIAAIERAMKLLQPGELLVIQPDKIDDTLDYVQQYLRQQAAGQEIDLNKALATVPQAAVFAGEALD